MVLGTGDINVESSAVRRFHSLRLLSLEQCEVRCLNRLKGMVSDNEQSCRPREVPMARRALVGGPQLPELDDSGIPDTPSPFHALSHYM